MTTDAQPDVVVCLRSHRTIKIVVFLNACRRDIVVQIDQDINKFEVMLNVFCHPCQVAG
jgi:hypothetical protein